jgi:UDP-N-acetylmuramoyl-tripeptide--D-alanyl-D-alanine ligase
LQTRFVGEHFWLPTAAAATAALSLGIDPGTVVRRVASFEPLFTRMSLMSVPNGPDFIVDTAKAPWHSIPAAFRVLEGVSAPRRRIVLGHMSDFSGSDQKYRDAYRLARSVADQVIFVGNHSHRAKASQADREGTHFLEFKDVRTAARFIRETAVPGELILLKGSVDLHLERIALAFESDVACWISACGKPEGCRQCGRWQVPQPRVADSLDPGSA